MKKSVWIVIALGVVAAAVLALLLTRGKSKETRYRFAKVERGDVTAVVTATGTLSAVTTVKVGSQVSGIIAKLYVDFNSEVKKGQLLAELDPASFQASVEQRTADVTKAKVELRNADVALVRAKRLSAAQLLAQSDLDAAQTARDAAAASVAQADAALKQAKTNLVYSKITSPIDGVIVDRQYDVGQTVAASFQAPTLFTIAQDLTKMQVLTNIDEADVGRVKVGQEARFNVDAFPDVPFRGAVSQIRLSPQTVQNVVTYPVVLDVANADLKLKPGMTANVQVPVEVRRETLKVPNAALRFKPEAADVVATPAPAPREETKSEPRTEPRSEAASTSRPGTATTAGEGRPREGRGEWRRGGGEGGGRPSGGGGGGRGAWGGGGRPGASKTDVVYVEVPNTKEKLKAVTVKSSITDGNFTAVESTDLKEGDLVVVGLATARAGDGGGRPPGGGGGRRPF